jgi:hypothetical protein
MSRTARTWLIALVAIVALLQVPGKAMAVDCAFQDVNDNGLFDGGDVIVPDAAWLGGAPFVSNHPFVVPVTCDKVLAVVPAPSQGVMVTATKITFLAQIDYLPPGGRGIVFIADPAAVPAPALGNGDLIVGNGVNQALIKAGGANVLPINTIAVARKSVALIGTGNCTFKLAELRGNLPLQDTRVGVLCTKDITFQNSKVVGSRVNIQSLTGSIFASGTAVPPGFSLVDLCDDPATNLTGNGNNNNISDAPDFPCQINPAGLGLINFPDQLALAAACADLLTPPGGNLFHAFNDPLIMVAGAGAGKDLDVRGASIVGRYRVTLGAEDGNLLTQNAVIDHGEQLNLAPPGGARIWLFANPASVVRLPVDREDFFGPSTGTTNITGACYKSPNPVNVGRDGGGLINLIGVPAPPPCLQTPPDFVPVLNGIF